MRKLLVYLKDYKKESILSPVFKLLEASFELLVPLVVASIIDKGIKNADSKYIISMCILIVFLAMIGLASTLTAQFFAAKAAVGFTKKVKKVLFRHLQSLSFSEIDRLGADTMVTRMTSDMNQIQTGLNLTLRLLLRSPFIVFGAMIMAFTIDVKAALVFAVAIPLLFAVVLTIMIVSVPLYRKVQLKLDVVLGKTRENLTGARVIRAFGIEDKEIEEFEQRNSELTVMQKHVGKISALMNPLTFAIINIAIIILVYAGAIRVDNGIISQGQVVALYNYMAQILVELIKMANLIITITRSVASCNRIQAALDTPAGDENRTQKSTFKIAKGGCSVEFRNVSLRYINDSEDALTDITFKAEPGEVIGVIGGTGSGKSSLVNMIPAFYPARQGQVFVDGVDVNEIPAYTLRQMIGVVPQKAKLFKGTIRENLLWGNPNASNDEINEALKAAQASNIIKDKENGIDSSVEQNGRNLSGGQKQRLTIARALIRKPRILILDDSSSALDFATDAALRKAISALPYKPTVFVVSQRTSAINHANKILVLDDGKLVGLGTHADLLKECAVYREIFDSQFKKEAAQA